MEIFLLKKVDTEIQSLQGGFCGETVFSLEDVADRLKEEKKKLVYIAGDVQLIWKTIPEFFRTSTFVITDYSYHLEEVKKSFTPLEVRVGQVPRNVHGVGVWLPDFFDSKTDYFEEVQKAHPFRSLRLSTKPDEAYRTGTYLSRVWQEEKKTHFHLLRCSRISKKERPTLSKRWIRTF